MSTRAFVGTLVGATIVANMVASLSYWLGLIAVIIGAVFLLLSWQELSIKRRVASSVALLLIVILWQGYSSDRQYINIAKNMSCSANQEYTIGQVLGTVCKRPRWNCFASREEEGTQIVEFTGKTKKGTILLQFAVKDSESSGETRYAEFNGKQMSLFEIAAFFNQAYDEYIKKQGK